MARERLRVGAQQRLAELPHDAGPAELAERIVAAVGPDDRAGRQLVARPVVVGDDDVEPELARVRDLLDRGHAAVDGQHEADALAGQPGQRLAGDAVALVEAARQVVRHVRAELAQDEHRERGRADAVGVVVAVDADPRPRRDRRADRLAGLAHVAERERVVRGQLCLEERARLLGVVEAAAREHGSEHFAHLELGREALDLAPLALVSQLPRHGQSTVRRRSDGYFAREFEPEQRERGDHGERGDHDPGHEPRASSPPEGLPADLRPEHGQPRGRAGADHDHRSQHRRARERDLEGPGHRQHER